ncbi:MAG: AAA family ATPase, partial [Bacteroidaceae bacterium]|nr:AAA family ATPase [Bacteroidaceae bacterium]
MASYINIGNDGFKSAIKKNYVDKSGLIGMINDTLFGENRFTCVSRCRRFGKSMAAKMLCAYYDRSCDSRELFRGLEAETLPDFEQHLNKYPVIYIDMTSFMTRYKKEKSLVNIIQESLIEDISEYYQNVPVKESDDLMAYLLRVSVSTGDNFIIIIDEWDAICREFASGSGVMDEYVDFLRRMFKGTEGQRVFAAAYLTGILPIKKYKTESALNNFWEYSMINPMNLPQYFGFTKTEVKALCDEHNMDFSELEKWYDGYSIGAEPSMFNPSSVMKAIVSRRCRNYWATTGAFDAVTRYIQLNYEGLRDSIVMMLAGGRCKVET